MANTNHKCFKLGHINVRSLIPSLMDLSYILTTKSFDVMAVTETWLTSQIPSNTLHIDGFSFYRRDRIGRGGGIGAFVKSELHSEILDIPEFDTNEVEMLWLRVNLGNLGNSRTLLGVIYRPPQRSIEKFLTIIDNTLSFLVPTYDTIILTGDLNVNFLVHNKVTTCFQSYGLQLMLNEPTRITDNSATLLDPIFLNDPEICEVAGTYNADSFSDHLLVYCQLFFKVPKKPNKSVTYRDFKHMNYESLHSDLFLIDWENILYFDNINDKVSFLTENILHLFDKHAPLKNARISKFPAPWLTDTLKIIMRERDKAHSKYRKNPTIENMNCFKQLRNFAKASVRREKAAYLKFLFQQKNSSSFFKALKDFKIQHSKATQIPTELSKPDEVNCFFASVFNTSDIECSNKINYYQTNRFNNNCMFQLRLTDLNTVSNIVNGIKSNVSGIDGVSTHMIKLCFPVIGIYILHIINCCLEQGYFPESWKQSLIVPLPKTPNPVDYSDLRPISLLPILSKILEKVIYQQLNEYLNEKNLLPVYQSGFRKGYSTTTALSCLCDDIITASDKGQATVLALVDFSKAFDTLNHKLLISKCKYFGFDTLALRWLDCYLTGRCQLVKIGSAVSESKSITSGVPQGSVLGPLLFLIYTLDLSNTITQCKIQCFADDTQIYYSFESKDYLRAADIINQELASLHDYASQHNLRMNPAKTKAILFCSKKHRTFLKASMNLYLENESIQFASRVKNLGILIDENLRFNEYTSELSKSCYLRLKLLFASRHLLSFSMKKKLCECLVISKITYCNVVYFPCLDHATQYRIQKIQNACCRLVFNLRKYDHVTLPISTLKWMKVNIMFQYSFLSSLSSIMRSLQPRYLSNKLVTMHSVHKLPTRFGKLLLMPHHRTSQYQRSFTYNAVRLFNSLSNNLKRYFFEKSFKIQLKSYLLEATN